MRHRRLRHPDRLGEIAHAQLPRLEQGVEQPSAGGVTQQLELLRQASRLIAVDEAFTHGGDALRIDHRSEEHTFELQSLMRNSYAVLCLKIKSTKPQSKIYQQEHIMQH